MLKGDIRVVYKAARQTSGTQCDLEVQSLSKYRAQVTQTAL